MAGGPGEGDGGGMVAERGDGGDGRGAVAASPRTHAATSDLFRLFQDISSSKGTPAHRCWEGRGGWDGGGGGEDRASRAFLYQAYFLSLGFMGDMEI